MGFCYMDKLFGHKFRHCERTSYFTTVAFIASLVIGFMIYKGTWAESINWFYLALLSFVGGWLGVLYYRISKRKKIFSKETLFFWSAKP